MQILIRKYEKQDKEQLQRLLRLTFEDSNLVAVIESPRLKCAFSALYEDELVGVIFAWKSSFHPFCTYFRIICNPLFNRMNVAKRLLSEIEDANLIDYPLQTSIWETTANLKEFYEKNGFSLVRKTYMPTIQVAGTKELIGSKEYEDNIVTLAEVLKNQYLKMNLYQLVKNIYEETHKDNPVAAFGLDKWEKIVLEDDVIVDGSIILLDTSQSEILAYSFLHESENKNTLELGWCGVKNIQDINLIPKLVLRQMMYADEHGFQFVQGEFDTTSKYAMEVIKTIPFPPCATWITYQKGNS